MSLGFVASDDSVTNASVSNHLTTKLLVASSIVTSKLTALDATINNLTTTNDSVEVSITKLNTTPITVTINNPNMSITDNKSTFVSELNMVQIQASCVINSPSDLPQNQTILVGQVDPDYAPPIDRFLTASPNLTALVSLWIKTTGEIYAFRTSNDAPESIPFEFTYIISG